MRIRSINFKRFNPYFLGFGALAIALTLVTLIYPYYILFMAEMDSNASIVRARARALKKTIDAQAELDRADLLKQAAETVQGALTPEYLRLRELELQERLSRNGNSYCPKRSFDGGAIFK